MSTKRWIGKRLHLAGLVVLLGATLAFSGCSGSSAEEGENSGGFLSGLFASTKPVTLPVGTKLSVALDHSISSDGSSSGDRFEATVLEAVVLDGKTVIPQGARVEGLLVEARESGRLKTPARLRLALQEIEVEGDSYEVASNTLTFTGQDHKKRNIGMIGGGAGAGAIIGGIAGGGKGAAIGAAVGAGSGTAVQVLTKGEQVRIPSETRLEFRLEQPVTINYTPRR